MIVCEGSPPRAPVCSMNPFLFQDLEPRWGGEHDAFQGLTTTMNPRGQRRFTHSGRVTCSQKIDTVYVTNHRRTRYTISLFTHVRMYHRVSWDRSNGHTTVSLPLPLAELHNRGIDPFLPPISLVCGSTLSTVHIIMNFNSNVTS